MTHHDSLNETIKKPYFDAMKVDPTATTEVLREQLLAAIELADEATLKQIAESISQTKGTTMAKEPQVPYEPEVPLILRKPSDEQLARELNESAARNDHISSEEAHARLIERFG